MNFRWIPDIPVDRAQVRTTLTYQVTPDLRLGLEYNPRADDLGLLANWRVIDETRTRPAVILGTSSARIGTDEGRAYYATASKDLSEWTGLPIAPYVGIAWDGEADRFRDLYGAVVRYAPGWTTTHFHDGVNLHHMLMYADPSGYSGGLIVAEQEGDTYLGVTLGMRFGGD